MDLRGIIRPMELSFDVEYSRLLRATGMMAWLFSYILLLTSKQHGRVTMDSTAELVWTVAYLLFPLAMWGSTSEIKSLVRIRLGLLAVQALLALCMRIEEPSVNVNLLLLVVTWQVVLYFDLRQAIWWLTIQLLLYVPIDIYQRSLTWLTLSSLVIYFFFKVFTCGLIVAAKREGALRMKQTQIIADLHARQEHLAESARMSERLRISRELHDALGHGLTALALHLEVALNDSHPLEIESHVRKSQMVARGMLADVREVVGSLRTQGASEKIDLPPLLSAVVRNIPKLQVHLSMPDSMPSRSPEEAHAMIRCVQEISTNTLKHADAENLWLTLTAESGVLRLTAVDDGKGAEGQRNMGGGLEGMQERFHALGGTVEVSPSSSLGFCVTACLPTQSSRVSQ